MYEGAFVIPWWPGQRRGTLHKVTAPLPLCIKMAWKHSVFTSFISFKSSEIKIVPALVYYRNISISVRDEFVETGWKLEQRRKKMHVLNYADSIKIKL